MSIFLDTSRRRKIYFRGITAFFLFILLGSLIVFFFGLSFSTSTSSPLNYAEAAERYHYYYSAANDKKIALTIDDGPTPVANEQMRAVLESTKTPATFFFIGEKALIHPDLVKTTSDEGFSVESHSFTHSYSTHNSYQRLAFELHSTGYLLSQITGKKAELYRPPYLLGIGIDPTINPYIKPPQDLLWVLETGYLPVGSDIDPKDWIATSTEAVITGLVKALHDTPNGHIVLLHEDLNTAKSIRAVVEYLQDHGYTIVPLQDLISPPTSIALAATLKAGDTDKTTNGDVSRLQWFLYKEKYLDPYQLTGVFDEQTTLALSNFQIENKLVNESNPNPAIVGIAGPATRAAIQTISAETAATVGASAVVHAPTLLERMASVVVAGLRDTYVYVFPAFHQWLVVMIFVTLLLVLGRSLGLVSLILYEKVKQKKSILQSDGQMGVSILIPAYNEQENIAATVESVIRTSYPRREIIVIDDGSKDNTSAEVESVIRAYPNDQVRLVRTENGGKARALNVGISNAQYEIIVVLDADAVLDKDAIWHFTKHFVDDSVGAVAGKVRTTGSSTLLDLFQTLEYAVGQNIDKRAFSTVGAVGVVPGPAGAWRKSTILELGGFSTDTLVEDQDMTLTVLRSGARVVYEDDAVAYTETPHTVKNFLKQRFRWVYGTMQCFWKHKAAYAEPHGTVMSLVVLPNIFIFNIILPLIYPFADSALLFGLFLGDWRSLILPFLLFTGFDVVYAMWGVWREKDAWKLLLVVPLQRIVYRQLLYYSVMKGVVRAVEGTGSSWNKFTKKGETKRFFFTSIVVPVPSSLSAVGLTDETQVEQLPQLLTEAATMSENPSPSWTPNILASVFEEPSSYNKKQ
jgi:cellulose synthase/poly-beta-1,6-N-acetylglucosamine synthase-like glycosyltransferase/peptidoglycan/xylan/chitin deacetylase (PgdA/CDA1 family)